MYNATPRQNLIYRIRVHLLTHLELINIECSTERIENYALSFYKLEAEANIASEWSRSQIIECYLDQCIEGRLIGVSDKEEIMESIEDRCQQIELPPFTYEDIQKWIDDINRDFINKYVKEGDFNKNDGIPQLMPQNDWIHSMIINDLNNKPAKYRHDACLVNIYAHNFSVLFNIKPISSGTSEESPEKLVELYDKFIKLIKIGDLEVSQTIELIGEDITKDAVSNITETAYSAVHEYINKLIYNIQSATDIGQNVSISDLSRGMYIQIFKKYILTAIREGYMSDNWEVLKIIITCAEAQKLPY